ncbi:MAG: primosomal protein N' [Anaerolineae bacterium]
MYAEIAVDVSVRGTFTYSIPPALRHKLMPGHLVEVPFATAVQPGIVVALLDSTDIEYTKPIRELLDPDPVVTLDQLDLARWMSSYYLAPLSACLWLMLPPGIVGSRDVRITLLDEDAVSPDHHEQAVIDLLKKKGTRRGIMQATGAHLTRELPGVHWRPAVDSLVKEGWVECSPILTAPRVKPKIVSVAELAAPYEELEDVDFGPRLKPHTVERFHRILRVLSRESQPLNVSVIYAQTGATLQDLRKLEDYGLVNLGEQEVIRDSLADRDFVPTLAPRLTAEQQAAWAMIGGYITPPAPRFQGEQQDSTSAVINRDSANASLTSDEPQDSGAADAFAAGLSPFSRNRRLGVDNPAANASLTSDEPQDSGAADAFAAGLSPFSRNRGKGAGGLGVDSDSSTDSRQWAVPTHLWDKLKPLAHEKRLNPTPAEDRLWQELRHRRLLGHKFRRQHSIDRFIVDFYCGDAQLIIEVDGEIHQYSQEEDALRQQVLESLGFTVLRFTNEQVLTSTKSVTQQIERFLSGNRASFPLPEVGVGVGFTPGLFLLHGVTGSGKTEIYLRAIEETLRQGRQAILLVPEIALTAQTIRRVMARFAGHTAILHGSLTPGERYDTWRRARAGKIDIIVGARSALFAPLPDVGLVILDEEHDHSYKQSPPFNPPHYHAREIAERLMRDNDGVLILGSATPDVETFYRAQRGELRYLHLPNRIMGHRVRIEEQAERVHVTPLYRPSSAADALTIDLPAVHVVDMRAELKAGNTGMFSRELHAALERTLERREQAILFLNRRGHNTYVFCRDCGYIAICPRCDTPLTFHSPNEKLRCHHCGYETPQPHICPVCRSQRIKYFGAGTQQVELELRKVFPQARTLRWDADTASDYRAHEEILQRFIDRQADILVGTQMIAKGLDLPLVTLVGVVSADMGIALPDFRAGERTFQLLTQVAGRAGRGLLGGQVVLQTYQPGHYAIAAASKHDYATFYERELAYRRELNYPPFRRLVRIVFRFPKDIKAQSEAERAAAWLRDQLRKLKMTGTEMIGPAPCFFHRVDNHFRWQIILRGPSPADALKAMDIARGWYVDIDPVDVL